MAKVQISSAITLDGYLPDKTDPRLSWIENNRKGFPKWRDSADCILSGDVSFLTLINQKRIPCTDCVYLAELLTEQQLPIIKGLLAYGLADEVILYILPIITGKGIQTSLSSLPAPKWALKSSRTFSNGISRLIYSKTEK